MKILTQGKCRWDFFVTGQVIVIGDDMVLQTEETIRQKILVVHSPSPDIVVYMKSIVAIVAEAGGILSHLSVLAMEMGCPVVVAANGITKIVKSGMNISVLGKEGVGYIYET